MSRIVRLGTLLLAVLLASCSTAPDANYQPRQPQCDTAPAKEEKDGGLGGTGIRNSEPSPSMERKPTTSECPN